MQFGRAWFMTGVLSVMVASSVSVVAGQQADQIIKARIANFREIGTANKCIKDELSSGRPNLMKIRTCALLIKTRGADMLQWFPPGSEPPAEASKSWLDTILGWLHSDEGATTDTDDKSHAKSAVWTQRAQFEQSHSKFESEANRMVLIAESGQVAAVPGQFARLGEACKACHDVYREKLD
jgi:hypothetical protein